ncbi:MAG: hypothetical protein IJN21_06690, partial [Clostridia bacterium]|nr:hypothetical protein [Clostridia bacterium]
HGIKMPAQSLRLRLLANPPPFAQGRQKLPAIPNNIKTFNRADVHRTPALFASFAETLFNIVILFMI